MPDKRLIKTVMLGMVEGDNKRGRPPTAWTDDIKQGTKMSLTDAMRSASDRDLWRKIIHGAVINTNGQNIVHGH